MGLSDWATQRRNILSVALFKAFVGLWCVPHGKYCTISTMLCFEGQMLLLFPTEEVENITLAENKSCVSHRRQKVFHRLFKNLTVERRATFYSFNMMEVEKAVMTAVNRTLSLRYYTVPIKHQSHSAIEGTVPVCAPLGDLGPMCSLHSYTLGASTLLRNTNFLLSACGSLSSSVKWSVFSLILWTVNNSAGAMASMQPAKSYSLAPNMLQNHA